MSATENNIFNLLHETGSTFTEATGSSLTFVGKDGDYLLPLDYRLFTDFCNYVMHSKKGLNNAETVTTISPRERGICILPPAHMDFATSMLLLRPEYGR
jgi:hypothetical protein